MTYFKQNFIADDLSKRMLNPEMTPETEESLYNDALNIYSTYLDSESADYLNLPDYISQGMKQSNKERFFKFFFCIYHLLTIKFFV